MNVPSAFYCHLCSALCLLFPSAYAQNAEGVRNDPVLSKLFERIVDLSGVGISPQELKYESSTNQPTVPGPSNTGGPQGVLPAMPGQTGAPTGV